MAVFIRRPGHGGRAGAAFAAALLGQGAPPDRVQAYKWAELSSELGNGDARKVLTELKPIMSEAEVGEGKRLVEEWKTRHAKASLTVNDNDGAPPNIPALSGRRPH